MLRLEVRPQPSARWGYASPLLALAITVVIGVILFVALGKDPVRGLQVFFWEPIKNTYAWGEIAIKATPLLLIVSQPTWGVDVGAAAQIRAEILALRDAGCAVLVISEELDELFELSDRLHVIAKGQLSPSLRRREATVEQIGQWMSGLWPGAEAPTQEDAHAAA